MELYWFILLGVYVAVTAAVVMFLRAQRRRAADDEEARCGFCGYPTRGLPTSICPECGQDLNVVGTRRPTWWNRLSPTQRLVRLFAAWTLGVVVLIALGGDLLVHLRPGTAWVKDAEWYTGPRGAYQVEIARAWQTRARSVFRIPRAYQDYALAAWAVSVHEAWSGTGHRPAPASPCLLTREPFWVHNDVAMFVVDPRDLRYAYVESAGGAVTQRQGPGWRADLDDWLNAIGHRLNQPNLQMDVNAVLESESSRHGWDARSQRPKSTPSPEGSGVSHGPAWTPDRLWTIVGMSLAVLVWLAGCWWIRQNHGRRGNRVRFQPRVRVRTNGG